MISASDHPRSLAVLLAAVLVGSLVAPAAFAGSTAAAPAGMASIPDANVAEEVPAGESIPLSAADLQNGRVMASDHADSLDVILTTPDRAATIMGTDSAAISGNGMAVVLRDDQHSAGRRVALDAGRLQDALGYQPEAIYGTHDDGSEWTASASYVDGYLVFDVPHFSSNTVTFSGEVTIDATSATTATQFQYELGTSSSVANSELTLTGSDTAQSEQRSYQGLGDGATRSLSIGGTEAADIQINMSGVGAGQGSQEWSYDTGDPIYQASPTVSNGTVYVGNYQGTTYAVDASTGNKKWSFATGRAIDTKPAVSNGIVYITNFDGTLSAFDASTGNKKWEYTGGFESSPTVSDGTVYVGSDDNSLYAVDASTGNKEWDYATGGQVKSAPTVSDGTVYVGSDDNSLYAVHTSTGNKDWSYATGSRIISSPTVSDGTVYVGSNDNSLYAVDASTGNKEWSLATGGEVRSSPTVLDGTVYVGSNDNSLYAVDASTGNKEWSYATGSRIKSSPTVSDGTVYVGSDDNSLYAVDASTGNKEWSFATGGSVGSSPTVSDGTVYVGSGDNSLYAVDTLAAAVNPSVSIGSQTVSYNGNLTGEMSYKGSISSIPTGSQTLESTTDKGEIEAAVSWTETTETIDPSITISSDVGDQTVDYSGTLSDGSTADLSSEINNSKIGGSTTVTVSVDDPASGPAGQVALNYSHSAKDQISNHYEASTFEESYNISHTYADATKNAQATIPFASSRVVGVKNAEYRVDGGSWNRVASTNYRFEGTTLDVYLDDATGGVEAGQTVDVRATGRKVTVDNGEVTITDPTKPGDDLDTQLRIDDRSQDFALNVGPTANGRRVHYATSNDYPTEDYVVIQANGDQDLHLPQSRAGDRFRVQHLKTKVEPKQGDVRIDVLKAGSNPELDVSPGPGGAGDPVDFKYYRTESGAEYLLKSLTDSIVRDSDVAQSPAIFEDDDSDETLAITLDSVASTASQTGGAVGGAVAGAGQFAADQATGLLGMISLPVDGSPILWLLGIVGLGFVVFRTDLLSGSGDGLDDAGEAAGGLTRTAGRAVSGAGSGILAGLRGLLGYLGEIAAVILSNRRATIVATILLAISLSAAGVIPITEDVAILLVLAGIPIASYIGLRSNGLFSQRVWLASTAIATLVGVELVAPGTLQIAIEQLTSEAVAPLLILLVGGAAYLYYRTRQAEASTPGTVIRTVIGNDDDDGNN